MFIGSNFKRQLKQVIKETSCLNVIYVKTQLLLPYIYDKRLDLCFTSQLGSVETYVHDTQTSKFYKTVNLNYILLVLTKHLRYLNWCYIF